MHFREIHTFESKSCIFLAGYIKRHVSIQLLFSARTAGSAPVLALELDMLMGRTTQLNLCTKDKRCARPKQMFSDFRALFRRFPYFSRRSRSFPADFRAFPVSAFWLRKRQTCKSGKEAVTRCPTANGDGRQAELSVRGHI